MLSSLERFRPLLFEDFPVPLLFFSSQEVVVFLFLDRCGPSLDPA